MYSTWNSMESQKICANEQITKWMDGGRREGGRKLLNVLMDSCAIIKWLYSWWLASFLFIAKNLTKTWKMYFRCVFVLILTNGPGNVPIHESFAILWQFSFASIFTSTHQHSFGGWEKKLQLQIKLQLLRSVTKPIFIRPSKEWHEYIVLGAWIFSDLGMGGSYRSFLGPSTDIKIYQWKDFPQK